MVSNYLEFYLKSIQEQETPEAGDTNGYFVEMMKSENTKHNIQKTLTTQDIVEYLLFTLLIAWLTRRAG